MPAGGGLLDLQSAYPAWDSNAHFMVTALTFVKKIFYLKDDDLAEYEAPANPAAAHMFKHDKPEFQRAAAADAARSQEEGALYGNPEGSPIAFAAPDPHHAEVRSMIVESDDHTLRTSSFILEILKKAQAKVEEGSAKAAGGLGAAAAAEGT